MITFIYNGQLRLPATRARVTVGDGMWACQATQVKNCSTLNKHNIFVFVTHTIIQSIITNSEICALHLTHPSAHTHLEQWGYFLYLSICCCSYVTLTLAVQCNEHVTRDQSVCVCVCVCVCSGKNACTPGTPVSRAFCCICLDCTKLCFNFSLLVSYYLPYIYFKEL